MSLHLALLIVISAISVVIGLLVYFQDRKNPTNKTFTLLVFSLVAWIITNYLCDSPSGISSALFWNKITMAAGSLIGLSLFFFALYFPREFTKISLLWKVIVLVISLGFIILSLFTNLIVKDIEFLGWGTNIIQGGAFLPFVFWSSIQIIASVVILSFQYKRTEGLGRTQMKYLFFGLLIFLFFGFGIGVILPAITGSNEFAKFSPYFLIFLVGFTAYAILKHHLLNIRVIATESLVAAIVLVLFIQMLLAKAVTEWILRGTFLVLVAYFGYLLIKSVLEEIRRREEIQKLTDQLKKANIRLKELDRLKSEFLSVASHELNSPMAIILGYLHMILWEGFGKVDKNARQYLEKVYFKSKLLAKLVADLLNVSRIEQGRLKIEIQPVDLQATLKDLCEDYTAQAKEKELTFVYREPKPVLPQVLVDPDKLKEIITNLLSNAVKYTKTGGIDVWAEKTDSEVKVSVKDTGVGIPKEDQQHIGEKFYRVDNSWVREAGGTGLGLHLVGQYLKLMHGKLWFESGGESKGSTFYFTLPIAKK